MGVRSEKKKKHILSRVQFIMSQGSYSITEKKNLKIVRILYFSYLAEFTVRRTSSLLVILRILQCTERIE